MRRRHSTRPSSGVSGILFLVLVVVGVIANAVWWTVAAVAAFSLVHVALGEFRRRRGPSTESPARRDRVMRVDQHGLYESRPLDAEGGWRSAS